MTKHFEPVYIIPENNKGIITKGDPGFTKLIVVVEKNNFGDEELNVLQLIIKAIKLDFEKDIKIIQLGIEQRISLSSDLTDFQDIILFGVKPSVLGFFIEYNQYEVLIFEKIRMIVIDSLSELNVIKSKKALLWAKLQTMFKV